MNHKRQSNNISEIMEGFGKTRRALKGEGELLITSTNLNGLTDEREEEVMNLVEDDIDIMLFQETHRREDSLEKRFEIPGYKTYTNERLGDAKQGGGLAIYIKKEIMSNVWEGLPRDEEEMKAGKERLWILVHLGSTKLAICDCYLACLNSSKPEFVRENKILLDLMSREVKDLTSMGFKCVTVGDLNARVGHLGVLGERGNDRKVNENGKMLKDFALENQLVILNSRPMSQG